MRSRTPSSGAKEPHEGPREIHIVAPPPQFRRFGNAAAMGLAAFGICNLQRSMMNAGISVGYGHGTRTLTGQFIGVAGLAQFAAGIWQIANGDTFEGAVFTTFGGTWLARGVALIPGAGVLEYQASEPRDVVRKQEGILNLAWSIWVFIILAGNTKSHLANIVLFLTLNLERHFETAAAWTENKRITKAAAWFGFFCGLSALYNAAAILLNKNNFWFNVPVGHWYAPRPTMDEEQELQ
ncbi:hypothetical protein H4R18_004265 [Coemansia javaensis]|uniref:Uncharacterized protein n=1 Tax=Coemansia javaensis TaxID=2761396 RepID=A0A9W8H6L6_9FUNG|nr:hypothetical protein H4R18_004265 [Coemansia javaensis]